MKIRRNNWRLLVVATLMGMGMCVWAQDAAVPPGTDDDGTVGVMPTLKYDIVSFKRCPDGTQPGSTRPIQSSTSDSFGYHCQSIDRLIYYAYTTFEHPFQITGEPGWVTSELYEFTAKLAPEDVAAFHNLSLASRRMMIRGILADELKLKVHLDPTPHPVYDLVVGKGELKLTPFKEDEAQDGRKAEMTADPDGTIHFKGEAMTQFAEAISVRVDRQVINKTNLPGRYDFTTTLPLEHYSPNMQGDAADSLVPKTFEAVKALGLNLVSAKEVTGGLVVDHIERPPEN